MNRKPEQEAAPWCPNCVREHAERRARELADVLSGRWYAETTRVIQERERLCRLCIRPRPRWLPDWLYRRLLDRLLMTEFVTK